MPVSASSSTSILDRGRILICVCLLLIANSDLVNSMLISLCYAYPRSLTTGLGNRRTFLLLERLIATRAQTAYPNVSVRSYTLGAVSSTTGPQLLQIVQAGLVANNCSVLVVTAPTTVLLAPYMLSNLPLSFPHVKFVAYDNYAALAQHSTSVRLLPANVQVMGTSYLAGWFAAGAAAAAQCRTCAAFVSPHRLATESANAFARGMRWAAVNGYAPSANADKATTSCPLFHVFRSWDHPERDYDEELIAALLLEKGCDIIATWTDSDIIARVVASTGVADRSPWNTPANTSLVVPAFSIVAFTSLGYLVGDSVLVSVLFQLDDPVRDAIRQWFDNSSTTTFFVPGPRGSYLTSFSPKASRLSSEAGAAAYTSQIANYTMLCDGFRNTSGAWINVSSACMTETEMFTMFNSQLDYFIEPLDAFASPAECPPGTEPQYNLTDFALSCSACDASSFSAGFGASCASCPSGSVSNVARTGCQHGGSGLYLSTRWIVMLGVGSLALTLFVIWILLKCYFSHTTDRSDSSLAGTRASFGPEVGLVMIAVDPHRSLRTWRQDVELAGVVLETIKQKVQSGCSAHNGHWAYNCADFHLVLAPSPLDALRMAMKIEQEFRTCPAISANSKRCSNPSPAIGSLPIFLKIVVSAAAIRNVDPIPNLDAHSSSIQRRVVTFSHPDIRSSTSDSSTPKASLDFDGRTESIFCGDPILEGASLISCSFRNQDYSVIVTSAALLGADASVAAFLLGNGGGTPDRLQSLCLAPSKRSRRAKEMNASHVDNNVSDSFGDRSSAPCDDLRRQAKYRLADIRIPKSLFDDFSRGMSSEICRTKIESTFFPNVLQQQLRSSPTAAGRKSPLLRCVLLQDSPQSRAIAPVLDCPKNDDDVTPIFSITDGVLDPITLNRFTILEEGEVTALVLIASGLVNCLLHRLDIKLAQLLIRLAASRLQIRLDRVTHRVAGGGVSIFHQKAVVELICAEFLSAMDEQALREWLRSAAELRLAFQRERDADETMNSRGTNPQFGFHDFAFGC